MATTSSNIDAVKTAYERVKMMNENDDYKIKENKKKYAAIHKEVWDVLADLTNKLEKHYQSFEKEPKNFGFIGDLSRILGDLKNISKYMKENKEEVIKNIILEKASKLNEDDEFQMDRVSQDKKLMKMITDISKYIGWDIIAALDVCYEVLTDSNAHAEAKIIERELDKAMKRAGIK